MAVIAVGVPVITQVDERLSPPGKLGAEVQLVGASPALVGVVVEMARAFVKTKGLEL